MTASAAADDRHRMNILVIDYAGHPFQYDLSTELGRRGHTVTHTFSSTTVTPQAGFDTVDNVSVQPVSIGRPFERYHAIRRLRDEFVYGAKTVALARRVKPDRVLTSNVPLVSLLIIWLWAGLSRTRWTLWLQDMQSGLAGMVTGERGPVARSLRLLEHFLIRRAHRIVAISESFAVALEEIVGDPEKISVIENWAPLASMPQRSRCNAWSAEHGLADSFVFLYSGTLGMKHSPELLKALAEEFADDPSVEIVVVAEGSGADWLSTQAEPRPRQLPFQPFERLPDVLASADVLIVLLDPSAGTFSVPSKTLSYLCAGRPILGSIPAENAAAQVITERARAGHVVEAGDRAAFCAAARAMRVDAAEMERAGIQARRYAVAHFDVAVIGDRFERVLELDQGQPKE
jgi:glycosyltransferase involved in cell wall biosynthesis